MLDHERDAELIDYIDVVLKRKWLILIGTLACMVAGMLHGRLQPQLYDATSLLFVSDTKARLSARADTEVETPVLDVNFYRSVATADEIKLAMNEYSRHLADSLGIDNAGVSLTTSSVDNRGIRLTTTSQAPQLVVPIVHLWTDTFIARTTGLTAIESDRYHEFVRRQHKLFGAKLDSADLALERFEKDQRIMFLQQRKASYEKHISVLEDRAIDLAIKLKRLENELARTGAIVSEFEIDGVPLFLLEREQLLNLERRDLSPYAQQIAENLAKLWDTTQMQSDFELDLTGALLKFDSAHAYTELQQEFKQLKKAKDTLEDESLHAEGSRVSALLEMVGIDRELDKHGPVVTVARAVADDEMLAEMYSGEPSAKAVRKLERLKVYKELPNPTYQRLDEQRAETGVELETALAYLEHGKKELTDLQMRLTDTQLQFAELHRKRELLVVNAGHRREAINDQLSILDTFNDDAKHSYHISKKRLGELGREVNKIRNELHDRQQQLKSLKSNVSETFDQLNTLVAKRDRLMRDKETLMGIYERFTQRSEEAGIAREKSASGLRKITMAQTPKKVAANSPGEKSLVAGAVGLVAFLFLAFVLEYVQRIRALRGSN